MARSYAEAVLAEWRKVSGTIPENVPDETPVGLHVRFTLDQLRELERDVEGGEGRAAAPRDQVLHAPLVKSDDSITR